MAAHRHADDVSLAWRRQCPAVGLGNVVESQRQRIGVLDPGAGVVPWVLPAFTDSRWWRHAFPDCVAYGFFPMREMDLYEWWPLLHAADERIRVSDLGYATEFFAWLPPTLLV